MRMPADSLVHALLMVLLGSALVWVSRGELQGLFSRVWRRHELGEQEQGLLGWRAVVEDVRAWCLVLGWGAVIVSLVVGFASTLRGNGARPGVIIASILGIIGVGILLLGLVFSAIAGWMDGGKR